MQIAKAQGAFVATTCSGRNADFVTKLGADRAIDYTKERWDTRSPQGNGSKGLMSTSLQEGLRHQVPPLSLTMVLPSRHCVAWLLLTVHLGYVHVKRRIPVL